MNILETKNLDKHFGGVAAVDRLIHHSVILELDNESIRAKEAKNKIRT